MQASALISKVRRKLDSPHAQSPSPRDILDRAIEEYSHALTETNNKADAWSVNEFTLTTTADTRRYDVTSQASDFAKALAVVTVPSSQAGVIEPEIVLEMSALEQLPHEWAFLAQTNWVWSLWFDNVTQKARYVAFYRKVDDVTGFKQWMEIRPTPDAGEEYRVLYQVGNIEGKMDSTLTFEFPFPELNFYFTALVAKGVLYKCRWTNDMQSDRLRRQEIENQLVFDLTRYNKSWKEYIATLSHGDLLRGESYADYLGL